MLEKAKRATPASAADRNGRSAAEGLPGAIENQVDNELQAAIEYKIALSGLLGADKVIELLNIALSRRGR